LPFFALSRELKGSPTEAIPESLARRGRTRIVQPMKPLARISAGGLVFLGIVHCALTGRMYDLASAEALWFLGTGVMLIAAGLLTFSATMIDARAARVSSVVVNLLGFTLAIFAVPVIQEPHVYLLVAFFFLALISVSMLMFKSQTT
jgi:hypothetical protein